MATKLYGPEIGINPCDLARRKRKNWMNNGSKQRFYRTYLTERDLPDFSRKLECRPMKPIIRVLDILRNAHQEIINYLDIIDMDIYVQY